MTQEPITRHGFTWAHGSPFQYRVWKALWLIDQADAKLYYRTTA